ncbi:MAG: TRAP transporter TatT component family protein, partial [Myxococcota bacterium]
MRSLRPLSLVALAVLSLGSTGCLKRVILDGTVASTRKASVALNTISDFEVAEKAASAGIVQLEGYHYLAPDNEDALIMLSRAWASLGFAFIEDAMERAQDAHGEESEDALYHKERAAAAYSRSIYYGKVLMNMRHSGLAEAKKNAETIKAYFASFEGEEDA